MGSALGAVQCLRHLLPGGRSKTNFCNLEQKVVSATRKLNSMEAQRWGKLLKELIFELGLGEELLLPSEGRVLQQSIF